MKISKELVPILKDQGYPLKYEKGWYGREGTDIFYSNNKKMLNKPYKIPIFPENEAVIDWIFLYKEQEIAPTINDKLIKLQLDIEWLQFWYNTLLEYKCSLMYEFIGRLEEWFESNNYIIHIFPCDGIKKFYFNIELINEATFDLRDDYYNEVDTIRQAKHEAIIKVFELLKENKI